MASGGARARSGPAPDPAALRRDRDGDQWTVLPAAGRPSPAPEWPLTEPTGRERQLWDVLWTRPQAVMWERLGLELEVAMYARRFTEAEQPDSRVNLSTLVRQLADSLGLTVPGMRANRWRIEAAADQAPSAPRPTARSSARSRLKVVADGDG
ncbi:hypothetical protein MOV08_21115 [Streptomyces yunnanensis]|uniref:Terminase small subunit n=1 Tax=Streptomyces yunnanensis TaxID=156453 RepID=A0ABY8A9R1_9ACTN|nr:hypothetical protein [Streptomyces yunnanensis]WEB41523.1 hypothetical protein MOV08_21115 [Streptomyces yunnanensis]